MKYGFNNLIYNLKNQNSKITLLKQAGDLVTCTSEIWQPLSRYKKVPIDIYGTSGLSCVLGSSASTPRARAFFYSPLHLLFTLVWRFVINSKCFDRFLLKKQKNYAIKILSDLKNSKWYIWLMPILQRASIQYFCIEIPTAEQTWVWKDPYRVINSSLKFIVSI